MENDPTDRQYERVQAALHERRQRIEAGDLYGTKADVEAIISVVNKIQELRND